MIDRSLSIKRNAAQQVAW